MSTVTVGWMVGVVRKKILDEGETDFTDAELIGLYNLTLRLIVSLVPRAYVLTQAFQLAPGALQSLPSNALKLFDITRNMGTDGTTAGANITEADAEAMRRMVPSWSTTTATAAIEHFMRIPGMDVTFHCYPPNTGTGYVEAVFPAVPPTVVYDEAGAWETERIPLSDEFVPAIPDGIMFHAYDDDTDIPGNTPRSQLHYQRILSLLGIKSPDVHAQQATGKDEKK